MVSLGRLKKRADFLRIAAVRNKWVAPGLILQMDSSRAADPRVGFTASKKTGNAIARNRAKRRLREAAKHAVKKYHPQGDIVLIARTATLNRPWKELIADIESGLKKLNERMEEGR